MGRLVVKGKAKRSYTVDAMTIKITFSNTADSTRDAIEWVQEQCESFLEQLQAVGINTENVVLKDDNVTRRNHDSEKEGVYARRIIELNIMSDLKMSTRILNIIRHNNYSCDYEIDYYITDSSIYRKELLDAAVEDSKMKAEALAKAIGKKLLGIRMINNLGDESTTKKSAILVRNNETTFDSLMPLSDNIILGTMDLSEEVEVTWIIEE